MATAFDIQKETDEAKIKQMIVQAKLDPYVPKKAKAAEDKNKPTAMEIEEEGIDEQKKKLALSAETLLNLKLKVVGKFKKNEFEKDDPTNWHIEFMNSCANLRARNYEIKEIDKLRIKIIAGKIIPAVATATAMIVGQVGIEIIKYLQKKPLSQMKSLTSNLAICQWLYSELDQVKKVVDNPCDPILFCPIKAIPPGHTVWDYIAVKGPMNIE